MEMVGLWTPTSQRMPDPKSKKRILAFTPTTDVVIRHRTISADLFKSVCSDATHWTYIEEPHVEGERPSNELPAELQSGELVIPVVMTSIAELMRESCDFCHFHEEEGCRGASCTPDDRHDGKDVYFKQANANQTDDAVYTYTSDMTRPLCPDCGSEVYQDVNEPAVAWVGVCAHGHKHTYQLDEDQEQRYENIRKTHFRIKGDD